MLSTTLARSSTANEKMPESASDTNIDDKMPDSTSDARADDKVAESDSDSSDTNADDKMAESDSETNTDKSDRDSCWAGYQWCNDLCTSATQYIELLPCFSRCLKEYILCITPRI